MIEALSTYDLFSVSFPSVPQTAEGTTDVEIATQLFRYRLTPQGGEPQEWAAIAMEATKDELEQGLEANNGDIFEYEFSYMSIAGTEGPPYKRTIYVGDDRQPPMPLAPVITFKPRVSPVNPEE